jgi:O-methyltransferase involved in polyketide biosynthesis
VAASVCAAEVVTSLAAQSPDVKARAASYTLIGTCLFDDWLHFAPTDWRQVVLLGAGFDTRALRLVRTTVTRLWEPDQTTVLDPKDAVLREVQASAQHQGRRSVWARRQRHS